MVLIEQFPKCLMFAVAGSLLMLVASGKANAHERDLRTQSDATGVTEISFCARPSPNTFGFPGHTFIAFSDKRHGGAHAFRVVGHTVASTTSAAAAVFTYFGGRPVAGQQAEERYTHVKQDCLTVVVDRRIYEQAFGAARPTLSALGLPDDLAASAESYTLNGNDCIDFSLRVVQPLVAVGLKVPTRAAADTPFGYLEKLKRANP